MAAGRNRALRGVLPALFVQERLHGAAVRFGVAVAPRADTPAHRAAHVVHHNRSDRAYACIHRGGVQREAAESADPDNADPFLIDDREDTERVNRGAEVFGIHVRRRHIAGEAAAFAGPGGIKGERDKTARRHFLRVEPGTLFLNGAERPRNRDRGELNSRFHAFRGVEVSREREAVAILEGDLLMVHIGVLRKDLVPAGRERRRVRRHRGRGPGSTRGGRESEGSGGKRRALQKITLVHKGSSVLLII